MRIVPDGIYYAGALVVAGSLLAYFYSPFLAVLPFVLAAFCLYFFRDPERAAASQEALVSPADGRVVAIRQLSSEETRISIFLNIFDVHVNRTPIAGRVTEVAYRPGKFLVASHEAASLENEQNTLRIESARGVVTCRQIAGLIARRIVCFKHAGDDLAPGERIGYIKFGSRVDVIFGPQWEPAVQVGDRVRAATSVLAGVSGRVGSEALSGASAGERL